MKELDEAMKDNEQKNRFGAKKETTREILGGFRAALPIIFGYFPIGMAFGVLAVQEGLSKLEVLLMSLLVFAGSSQFVAVGLLATGASVATIVFTTFLVNARHILMSAALAPYFKSYSRKNLFLLGIGVTDEAFAIDMGEMKKGQRSASYFLTLHFTAQFFWVFSTVVGAVLGNLVPEPQAWGLNFALPAMFIGLLLMQIKVKMEWILVLLAGGLSLLFAQILPGKWHIIIACIITATMGVIFEKWMTKYSSSSSV